MSRVSIRVFEIRFDHRRIDRMIGLSSREGRVIGVAVAVVDS